MKITVNQDPVFEEIEVIINCKEEDASVRKIVSAIKSMDVRIQGFLGNEAFQLEPEEILYIESVDRRTFLYTEKQVYETRLRLYGLEEVLQGRTFFRASKAVIINLKRVRSLRPELGSRLLLTMDNNEKIVVSRQYARNIKTALGVN